MPYSIVILPQKKSDNAGKSAPTRRALLGKSSLKEIIANQFLHELVPINLCDLGAGAVLVGDVSRIFTEEIAYDLVDRIIPLLAERAIYRCEDPLHLPVGVVYHMKFYGLVFHRLTPFLKVYLILPQNRENVKGFLPSLQKV